jgi:hypothetical protein
MLKENSYLAGSFPVHFREGDPQRLFMRQPAAVQGLGRVATRDGRKRFFLYDGNGFWGRFSVTAVDEPIAVGVRSDFSWIPDCAHQPDDHYPLYVTTGDPWFLEQLQFWASWGIFSQNASYDHGPKAPWNVEDAWFDNQGRGEAWCLRTRARAAWASPDGSAESLYFNRITNSALRAFAGMKLGPAGTDSTRNSMAQNFFQPNPLFAWKSVPNTITKPDTVEITQSWTQAFVVMALGHLVELGFDAAELKTWAGQFHITMLTSPGIDPRHVADYSTPTKAIDGNGAFFNSWQSAFANWPNWAPLWGQLQGDLNHGYPNIVNAAVSFTTKDPGGAAAWQWFWSSNYVARSWSDNPKWAILPRP